MNTNKIILCLKIATAGLIAFIILNAICIFYYNVPIHNASKTNSTDYIWEKNKFYSRGTEGFAWGITDKNGFNNLETFKQGEIDVIVMGSSHMEGFNVAHDKNTTAIMNSKFRASGIDMNVYNIGISGHTLVRCLNNLENVINEFGPQKYIVIETQSVEPSVDIIKSTLDGTLTPMASHSEGIMGMLQKSPYLRLVYAQLKNAQENNVTSVVSKDQEIDNDKNEMCHLLNLLMEKSAKICNEAGTELIIFYNCSISIDEQGKTIERKNSDSIEQFRMICENNDVIFIDMYEVFKENYEETYKLPRGFSNSKAGSGHLNEEGHRVIAEKLFSVICK